MASVFSGVSEAGGGVALAPEDSRPADSFPTDDWDRCLLRAPVDILQYSDVDDQYVLDLVIGWAVKVAVKIIVSETML